jgi:UDP-N-acetylglucosamine 2-epimerase
MEARNRCFDQNVPEETNRKIVDHISDINLPYTEHSRRYLLSEGTKAVDIEKYSSFYEKNTAEINSGNQLRIAYFVGLHLNRRESLAKVGEAIKEFSKKI